MLGGEEVCLLPLKLKSACCWACLGKMLAICCHKTASTSEFISKSIPRRKIQLRLQQLHHCAPHGVAMPSLLLGSRGWRWSMRGWHRSALLAVIWQAEGQSVGA